jgi:hypothetical protein
VTRSQDGPCSEISWFVAIHGCVTVARTAVASGAHSLQANCGYRFDNTEPPRDISGYKSTSTVPLRSVLGYKSTGLLSYNIIGCLTAMCSIRGHQIPSPMTPSIQPKRSHACNSSEMTYQNALSDILRYFSAEMHL